MRSYESLLRDAGGGLCDMHDIRYRLERLIDLARKDGAAHENEKCAAMWDDYSGDGCSEWVDSDQVAAAIRARSEKMTPKERAAIQQALEALEEIHVGNMTPMAEENWNKAITALREALKPTREGKYYYKDNACTADNADSPDCICWHDEALAEQAEQGPYAYEVWDANDQVLILIYASCLKEFYWIEQDDIARKLYAAPVRTKDLTDDEISDAIHGKGSPLRLHDYAIRDLRAVIAADREKNRG